MNENKYQDFLIKLQNADESEREWLVMEFSLQNLTDILRQAVWAAAIPHWFDHAFLNAVLGFELKDSDFETLKDLSFVEVFPERGFNIHERSRNLLLNYLWKNKKARFQKLSKHAATYCKKQDQDVTHWRVETLYHGLLANNLTAKDDFVEQALTWHNNFQYDKLENLTQIILEAVEKGKLKGDIAAYAHDFQAVSDNIYSRYDSAKKHLELALKQKIQNENLKADCFFDLGNLHLHFDEYIQARSFCQQALAIYQKTMAIQGVVNCIQLLGNIHCYLAEYNQSRDCYQRTLEIYKKNGVVNPLNEANCFLFFGDVHRCLAEYKQAADCYQQGLPIFQKINSCLSEASCTMSLGLLYDSQQQIELAVMTLKKAAQLYEKIGYKKGKSMCFKHLAMLYQKQKQFEQALINFNQAIEIYPDATCYQNRAGLYMEMDDYAKADADIKQAESIGKNPADTLLCKAELALWQQQIPQAIEFSQQAHAQRPADGNLRAFYALTLLANGQTEQANSEMQQALTAIYQPHDFANLLENVDKLIRIYGERAEFTAMRELIATCCKQPNEE